MSQNSCETSESQTECPTCGDSFDSESGMKIHHAQAHDESIAGVSVECENCGNSFRKRQYEFEIYDSHFCGDDCRIKHTRDIDEIERLCREEGFTQAEAAEELGVHHDTIRNRIDKTNLDTEFSSRCPQCDTPYRNLSNHWARSDCEYPEIDEDITEMCVGILMGDGSITGSGGKHYRMTVGGISKPFIEHISQRLSWLSSGNIRKNTSEEQYRDALESDFIDVGEESTVADYQEYYVLETRKHPFFTELRDWYSSGKKVFPDELDLTPTIAKYWYSCDGGVSSTKGDYIGNCFYTSNEIDREDYLDSLFGEAGFHVSIDKKSYRIRIDACCRDEFIDWMGEPVPGFDYKWADSKSEYEEKKPF